MMETWNKVEFGSICKRVGKNYIPNPSGALPYVGLEHIETGNSILSKYGLESEVKSSKTRFRKGQILYGKLRPYLDKAVLAPFDGICSTDILVFSHKDNSINEFLVYLIHSDLFLNYAKATTSGVQHPRTSWNTLKNLKLQVPSLPEQRKIAYVLSTVQKAIEKQDQLLKTTTELKKALMQKLFTEGLRGELQTKTEFGYSPISWAVQPFENTGKVIYGIQASVANNLKPIGKKILTNKNITLDGKIDLEKLNYFELSKKRHFETVLKKGDLLFNWRSGSKEHVGKTALFNLEEGEYTHSSFILRIRVNKKHHNVFLYYYLNFLREVGYYQKVQTYSINAKFNKSAINAMPIALPEKDEQIEIAKIISTIDKKLYNRIEKQKLYQVLFKTLLHELMTGQRRVHDLEFEKVVKEYEIYGQPLSMAAEPEL